MKAGDLIESITEITLWETPDFKKFSGVVEMEQIGIVLSPDPIDSIISGTIIKVLFPTAHGWARIKNFRKIQ